MKLNWKCQFLWRQAERNQKLILMKMNYFVTLTACVFLSAGCGKQSAPDTQTTALPSVPVQATNKVSEDVPSPRSTTPDQIFTLTSPRWGKEEFTVNFGAKTVKSGNVILGAGKPIDYDISAVVISDDSIAFVESLNQNLGGVTLVMKKHVTINRKDGTFTATDESNTSPTQGTWTSAEAKTP